MSREDRVGPPLLCPTYSPGVSFAGFWCSVGPLKFWVPSADALVCISLFKYKCFHAFSSDRIDGQSYWQTACYLPVPLCKLETSHDILADDIIYLLALGKQLEKENGLKQNRLEIAISGNSGAGVLLV